jgi:hypothetical protein
MSTDLTTIVVTVVSSGAGAGIVTFCMNFWKAESDFRRAKIEELYAAVHKYTIETHLTAAAMRKGIATSDEKSSLLAANYDRISLLIDLYFPSLHPTFKTYALVIESFLVQDGQYRRDDQGFREDLLIIGNLGDKLKSEVVALSRQGSLRALIEAVQEYDRNPKA